MDNFQNIPNKGVKPQHQPDEPLVVIIDDDDSAARLAMHHLKRAGYQTQIASDGETGIDLCRSLKPIAVLLDLRLPGMNGFEVCKILKSDMETRSIPVLILSAHHSREDVLKALQFGADDFLVKPIDGHVLLHKIGSILPEVISTHKDETVPSGDDRRKYFRLNQMAEGHVTMGMLIMDISENGIGLVSEMSMVPGTIIQLTSQFFSDVIQIEELSCRVKHCQRSGGRYTHRIGAEFVGLDEKHRKKLRKFIFQKQTERVKTLHPPHLDER